MNNTYQSSGRLAGDKIDRRSLFRRSATALAASSLAMPQGIGWAAALAMGQDDLVDSFLNLSDFGLLRPSPDGTKLIVEIMRPRSQPSRPGDHLEARSDLWLLTLGTATLTQLTFGAGDASAAWSPIWSPDGRRIAFLSTAGDGVPRARWIDIQTRQSGCFSQSSVNTEVNFGSRSPYFGDGKVWAAWLNPVSLICALHPDGIVDSAFRAGAADHVYPRLWRRNLRGESSVTVWDSIEAPVCDREIRLVRMSTESAAQEFEIAAGAIRAVTLSSDHRRAAVVFAVSALPPPRLGRFDQEFTFQNLDPRVSTRLAILDVLNAEAEILESGIGVRFQSDDDAPRWSRSGDDLYAPRFDVGEHGVENFGVVRARGRQIGLSNLIPARSRRHAQLLAMSLAYREAISPKDQMDRVGNTANSTEISGDAMGSNTQLFNLTEKYAVLCSSNEIRLIDLDSGAVVEKRRFRGATTLLSKKFRQHADIAVMNLDDGIHFARTKAGRLDIKRVVPPVDSVTPACLLPSGGVVWIERAQPGQSLWVCNDEGEAWRKIGSLPSSTAQLVPLQIREFETEAEDQRRLLSSMLLPSIYDSSKTFPVILDIYPFRNYSEISSLSAFNYNNFYDINAYYLASSGYIVVRPSLPDFSGDSATYNPIEYYTDIIERVALSLVEGRVALPHQLGLRGHSNGGYLALAVAARSKAISAVVADAPFPDLLTSDERPALAFSTDECAPNRFYANQIAFAEDPNGPFWRMGAPSYADLDRYLANSPIYSLNAKSPPTLIIQGEYDSKGTGDSERVFTRLSRLGVPVQLARYWGEGHNLSTAKNIRDAIARERSWFDLHLR